MAEDPPPPTEGKRPFMLQGRPLAAAPRAMSASLMPKQLSGMDLLKAVAENTTQQGIKQQIESARPKTFEELVQQRTKGMSRQDLLDSDFMWAKARNLHHNRTQAQGFEPSISKSVKDMADYMLRLNGHVPLSDEEVSKMIMDWLGAFRNTPFGSQ